MRLKLLALVVVGWLVACGGSPIEPTKPLAPPIRVTLSASSMTVGQEPLYIWAEGGNHDYRVHLIAVNYGGYPELDLGICLGYLRQSFNGATFLFRPEPTCSFRPDVVMVRVYDTDWNMGEAPLILKY